MAAPLVTLGFDKVLIRDYIVKKDGRSETIWTAILFRFLFGTGFYTIASLLLLSGFYPAESPIEKQVILILLLPLAFSFLGIGSLVLEAEVLSKYAVWIRNSVLVLGVFVKILLIIQGAGILAFAATYVAIEIATKALIFFFVWNRGMLGQATANLARFRELFHECWPLAISSLSVTLYMNIDVAMLKTMKGSSEAGVYSIAVTLSAIFYFLPIALSASLLPNLLQSFQSRTEYSEKLLKFFKIHTFSAYACIAAGLIVLPTLVRWLYGEAYHESARILAIHIWSLLFVFIGVARGEHLVAASAHKFSMLSTLIGLVINVALNLVLIPSHGGMGAATATLISYAVSAFVSSFFWTSIRPIGRLQLKALLFPIPFRLSS